MAHKKGMLGGNSYEVQTKKGSRWIIDSAHAKKYEAMERAGELQAAGKCDGVRVIEERKGDDQERIIFEEAITQGTKALKIIPVKESSDCSTLSDYYKFPARKTTGRLFRAFLDEHGICTLQLLFDTGYLAFLERLDTFFNGGVSHVAGIQAKKAGIKPLKRVDEIHKAFRQIREQARDLKECRPYTKILTEKGMDKAIKAVAKDVTENERYFYHYGMISEHLGKGSWTNKLSKLMTVFDGAKDPISIDLIDEVIAEILDGQQALQDTFGAPPSPIDAWRTVIQVVSGHHKANKYATKEIVRLNEIFAAHNLPVTKAVLLDRVSRQLKGTQPISREDKNSNREHFVTLVNELIEPTGILGGAVMSEAILMRTKILLSPDDDDLPIASALQKLIYLLPSNAARLGLLLDLTGTGVGTKYDAALRVQIGLLLDKVRTIDDLFPASIKDKTRYVHIESLRERVGLSGLSDEMKSSFAASFTKLVKKSKAKADSKPKPKKVDVNIKIEDQKEGAKMNSHSELTSGEVLFSEGDAGNTAYFIIEGTMEIYRTPGGKKKILSKLGKGEIIGEMSLIDNQPRMASARAVSKVKLACISQDDLTDRIGKLKDQDVMIHHVMRTLVKRLRGTSRDGE